MDRLTSILAISDVVVAAGLAAFASVIAAILGFIGVYTTRGNRTAILKEVKTGNDHTAGESLTRLEDAAWRHEERLDDVEIQVREAREVLDDHVDVTKDLIPEFMAMRPKLHEWLDEEPKDPGLDA